MITLNLIPLDKKESLRITQLYVVIKNLIILILIITIIIAIILLIVKALLQNHFNNIVEQTTLTTKYASTFNKGIKKFNQRLDSVVSIQKDFIPWTNFFVDFTSLVPPDLELLSLAIKENRLLINGRAKTRDKLLEFKSNLENSNLFSEVEIPLEDLLKKENVDVNIRTVINLNQLRSYEN